MFGLITNSKIDTIVAANANASETCFETSPAS